MFRLLVLSIAFSLVVAPAAAAPAKRCKKGEIRVAVDGKKVSSSPKAKGKVICVAGRGASRRTTPSFTHDPRLDRWRDSKRVRAVERFAKGLGAFAQGRTAIAAQARPVKTDAWRDVTRQYYRFDDPPKGVTVSEHDSKTEPRADEVGTGSEVELRLTGKDDRGYVTARTINGLTHYTTRCPDANGRVRGEYGFRLGKGLAERSFSFFDDANTRLDVTAEVGDDGQVKRYSYEGTLTLTSELTIAGKRSPTTTVVIKLSNQGLDPRATGSMRESFIKTGSFEIRGGRSADEREGLVTRAIVEGFFVQDELNKVLVNAEKPWQERRECVKVEITGEPATVMLGTSFSVTAVARAADNSVIGDATLTAEPGPLAGGTLSATSTGNPGRFTLSDYGGWTTDELGWPTIIVRATSRRGSGFGAVTVRAVPIPKPTAYWSVTFQGTIARTAHVAYVDPVESYTSDMSAEGSFTLVWPRVSISDEFVYRDGDSTGSLTYTARSHQVIDNDPDPPTTTTITCSSSDMRPDKATMSTTRAGGIDGVPVPPGPSVGFIFSRTPLFADITCHSSRGGSSSFETRLDLGDCVVDIGDYISPAFYVTMAQLREPTTTIALPGLTKSCAIDDGTASYHWDGKVTIVYHAS